ncbi:hypothetical protein DFQ27_005173 [Actinomortierella ambigua]|uniref:BD-FAE-like domain-containing protein n=1 Tax=Actinomortierella ambigua TaxID=1343610 RepID=A0A9P6Q0Z8_9FUNG|nr:hypothetical protein DFQ27_005173 [Actinomortierella ambigua]
MGLLQLYWSILRSMWAASYALASILTLTMTWVAIRGTATRSHTINLILSLLSDQLSELPISIMILDACYYTWLTATGTFQQSPLVRFFYYINIITAVGLIYLFKRAFEVRDVIHKHLEQYSKERREEIDLPGLTSPRFWQQLLNPFHSPYNTTLYPNIPYWTPEEQLTAVATDGWRASADITLDIYRPNEVAMGSDRPVLIYIHGGGSWTKGSKRITGPLVTEMLNQEWVVVSIDYRRSSRAGYPTQLIDCKRALRWIKAEIDVFGGNPNNLVVAGDSSGGHLAAMLALTPNQPAYQPGFEDVDTTVQGCIAQTAILDLTDIQGYYHDDQRTRFLRTVAKRGEAEKEKKEEKEKKKQEDGWPTANTTSTSTTTTTTTVEDAPTCISTSPEDLKFLMEHSPLHRITAEAPPFLVIHGDLDTIAPVGMARAFVDHFRRVVRGGVGGQQAMTYLEIPGGHHLFGLLSSPRTWYATIAAAHWLEHHFEGRERGLAKNEDIVQWGW